MPSLILFSLLSLIAGAGMDWHRRAVECLRSLSKADQRAARDAQILIFDLRAIGLLNAELLALYALCPAGVLTGAGYPALKSKGEVARVAQEILHQHIKIEKLRLQLQGHFVKAASLQRRSSGPCGIPGLLLSQRADYLRAWNQDAGFRIEIESLLFPKWSFYHPKVRTL